MPTKLEANASFKKPRLVFLVLALALVFGAVCVGGVSGATWNVLADGSLADVVKKAANNDIIVIHGNENDEYTITEQVKLESQKTITIKNAQGKHVTIKSGLTSTRVDDRTLFNIDDGVLNVESDDVGGSLTITTDHNGRAFDVDNAELIISKNVDVINCGFKESESNGNDGGAVYIRSGGTFTMNGGRLMYNWAGAGGAVCVSHTGGKFIMNNGLIYGNSAFATSIIYKRGGGGVYISTSAFSDKNQCHLNGGVIYDNSANYGNGEYDQVYGLNYYVAKPWVSNDGKTARYFTINDAYKADDFNGFVYLHGDITQNPMEKIVVVDNSLTILPAGKSVKLVITESSQTGGMFEVKGSGSLTFQNNGDYSLSVSGTNSLEGKGGAVYINGGSFTLSEGVTLSGLKAENGGAIYLNSGTCTLEGGKIQDCLVSGDGGAVYVADGTFTVKNSASVDASNDVYLEDGEVITAESDYKGTVGKITMPSYKEGTEVVNVKTDSTGYPNQFTLTADSKDELGEKILVLKTGNPNHLVISINPNYKITIPPNLIVNSDEMEYIVATILEIPKNARVDVRINGDINLNGDFTLKYMDGSDDLNVELPYDVMTDGKVVKNNDVVATFSRTKKYDVPINAVCTGTPVYAGNYEDRLTFTFVYVSGETGNTR